MPNPIAVRLFDALLGFLLRPRIRRLRRWSFLVTAPLGLLVLSAVVLSVDHVADTADGDAEGKRERDPSR